MAIITYLIKFSLSLAFGYAFYSLLLKRLTFYRWNRFFLLTYSLACFIIPFINIDGWLHESEKRSNVVLKVIPPFNVLLPSVNFHNAHEIAFKLFVAGAVLVLSKLIIQFFSLRRIRKNAVFLHQSGHVRIYSTDAGASFTLETTFTWIPRRAIHRAKLKKFCSMK